MRVLITGATGFLGFHLCRKLLSEGHRVTAFHRSGSDTGRLQTAGVSLAEGNLADLGSLESAFEGHDAVIHAAADIRYGADPAALDRVNAAGTANVAQACRSRRVGRLVHVSSVSAIGIPADGDIADETFTWNLEGAPLAYHRSKRRAELAVLEEAAKGLDAVIVNPGTIFGPHQDRFRGAEMILKVRDGWVAPHFTGGICTAHVHDVVDVTIAALLQGRSGERYILGGENITYREIARKSLEAFGIRRPLVPVPPLVTRLLSLRGGSSRWNAATHYAASRKCFYSSAKAARELGYAPRPFSTIVQDCLEFLHGRK